MCDIKKQNNFFMNFLCGMLFGVGSMWLVMSFLKNPRKLKKKALQCTNAIEDLIGNTTQYMFK